MPILATLLAAPLLPLQDAMRVDVSQRLIPPAWDPEGSRAHPLGTDQLGRDILSRLIMGGRTSLSIAAITITLSVLVGVFLGLVGGYSRDLLDLAISAVINMQLALPGIILALGVVATLGASLSNLVLVLTLVTWVPFAKVVRGIVISVREREFIVAARAIGAKEGHIIIWHIFPHVLSSVLVLTSLRFGRVIVIESALSFLGLGVPPPLPSWGNMLGEGREFIRTAYWLSTFPGVAITLTVLGVTLIGQRWLQRWIDITEK